MAPRCYFLRKGTTAAKPRLDCIVVSTRSFLMSQSLTQRNMKLRLGFLTDALRDNVRDRSLALAVLPLLSQVRVPILLWPTLHGQRCNSTTTQLQDRLRTSWIKQTHP